MRPIALDLECELKQGHLTSCGIATQPDEELRVINAIGRQNENIKELEILIQILNAIVAEIVRVLLTRHRALARIPPPLVPNPVRATVPARLEGTQSVLWPRVSRSSFQFSCSLQCSLPTDMDASAGLGLSAELYGCRRLIEIRPNFTISLIISDEV